MFDLWELVDDFFSLRRGDIPSLFDIIDIEDEELMFGQFFFIFLDTRTHEFSAEGEVCVIFLVDLSDDLFESDFTCDGPEGVGLSLLEGESSAADEKFIGIWVNERGHGGAIEFHGDFEEFFGVTEGGGEFGKVVLNAFLVGYRDKRWEESLNFSCDAGWDWWFIFFNAEDFGHICVDG